MKKVGLFVAFIIFAFIAIFAFTGYRSVSAGEDFLGIDWDNSSVKEVEALPHIGFSEFTPEDESQVSVIRADELADYESPFRKYASTVHYDTLSENGKLIYKAMEYAFENKYRCILVDETLCENNDNDDLYKIIRYLALDSPLIEQNLELSFGNFDITHPLNDDYFYERRVPFDGFYITVNNFGSKYFDKRLEAVKKAEEVVAGLEDGLTDTEKARALFRYLGTSTVYKDDYDFISDYLYDALIKGETICDGYANAISLLFNLADIPCFEKVYYKTSLVPGHTWNCFQIDGKWYNADCTATDYIPEEDYGYGEGVYFGYPDSLQSEPGLFDDVVPDCEEGLIIKSGGEFDSVNDKGFVDSCVSAYRESGRKYALLLVKEEPSEDDADKQLQRVANRIQGSFYYFVEKCTYGYFIFIHKK